MTLIVGSPGETDDDVRATLDLIYEVERRGLFAFFIPSIFTPLPHENGDAQRRHRNASTEPAAVAVDDEVLEDESASGAKRLVGPDRVAAECAGAGVRLWRLNGLRFTWPLFMFASAVTESLLAKAGRIYVGQPLNIKTRNELLATIRPSMQCIKADTRDAVIHSRSPVPREASESPSRQAFQQVYGQPGAGTGVRRANSLGRQSMMIAEGHEVIEDRLSYPSAFKACT